MSNYVFTDAEILELVEAPKFLPFDWREISHTFSNRGKTIQTVTIDSSNGFSFGLKLNQNQRNFKKFSLILVFHREDVLNKLFHLKRYDNGHRHINKIEGTHINAPHIHTATERYQIYAFEREDGYAEETNKFVTYEQALQCLFFECNIEIGRNPQLTIFGD